MWMKKREPAVIAGRLSGIIFFVRGIIGCGARHVMLIGMLSCACCLYSYPQIKGSGGQGKEGKCNGHDYVDLGLSVKWATCNVGASFPSDYGDCYAWGETSVKLEYTEANSAAYGKEIGDVAGDDHYDASSLQWGGSWRLPTRNEWNELRNQCCWTWMEIDGTAGYRVTGKNGHSIFLPAAGWRSGMIHYGAGYRGYYWSSTPDKGTTVLAYYFYFDGSTCRVDWNSRFSGRSIRPVIE